MTLKLNFFFFGLIFFIGYFVISSSERNLLDLSLIIFSPLAFSFFLLALYNLLNKITTRKYHSILRVSSAVLIFFLIPPTFTDLSLSKEFKQKLIFELRNFDINVIEEKRINEIKFYCNSPYHLSKIGRKIRTENLNMDLNKILNKAR